MFLVSIVFATVALAQPRPPTQGELAEVLRVFNEGARFPLPVLSEAQLQTLLEGEQELVEGVELGGHGGQRRPVAEDPQVCVRRLTCNWIEGNISKIWILDHL